MLACLGQSLSSSRLRFCIDNAYLDARGGQLCELAYLRELDWERRHVG